MRKVIQKYELEIKDEQIIEVPRGSSILSVASQNDSPVAYFLLDGYTTLHEQRLFKMVGTDKPLENDELDLFIFLGTVVLSRGVMPELVLHIFMRNL